MGFRCLITADMDIGAWKQLHHLVQNILQKSKSFLFRAIDMVENSPKLGDSRIFSRTAQFGISGNGGLRMPGHFYFGNNSNMPCGGIRHNLFDLFLCVITTVASAVITLRYFVVMPDERFVTISGDFL